MTDRVCVSGLVVLAVVSLAACVPAWAKMNFGLGAVQASSDGRLVEVNGGIAAPDVLGWTYDWGDGQVTHSCFPTIHRYAEPGTYTVTGTGYTEGGEVDTKGFSHTVAPAPKTEVASVAFDRPAGDDLKALGFPIATAM